MAAEYESQTEEGWFEGKLRYVASVYSRYDDTALHRESGTLVVTPKRLLFAGIDRFEQAVRVAPPGVTALLARNDRNDFVFYGDGYDAYQFRSYDMKLLGIAMKTLDLVADIPEFSTYEEMGRFALRGIRTTMHRYTSSDGYRCDVYLSSDYRVNWGVFSQSWLFGSGGLRIEELDALLAKGALPVRIELFSEGRKAASLNLMGIEETAIPNSEVALPNQKILKYATQLLKELIL